MKAMTIGISPEYNYPGNYQEWRRDNTYYASNFGGSLITRAIMREFSADYIDDFSDLASLGNKYDTCIMALATHAHHKRNIERLSAVVEQLQMKTIVLSLGVADYLQHGVGGYTLHPSIRRVLDIASESSAWIGVRGPHTASILHQNGYRNAIPVGCPTVFWNMKPQFDLPDRPHSVENPLVVYHKTLCVEHEKLLHEIPLLGQDYEDQAIFTDQLTADEELIGIEAGFYEKLPNSDKALQRISRQGVFPSSVDEWFDRIGSHDFVFGPRLHGCIAAMIQGVPAVMTYRDLRTREMVEVFNFPAVSYTALKGKSIESIIENADYCRFKETYERRYRNYAAFISENGLESGLDKVTPAPAYQFTYEDICSYNYLAQQTPGPDTTVRRPIGKRVGRMLRRWTGFQ